MIRGKTTNKFSKTQTFSGRKPLFSLLFPADYNRSLVTHGYQNYSTRPAPNFSRSSGPIYFPKKPEQFYGYVETMVPSALGLRLRVSSKEIS